MIILGLSDLELTSGPLLQWDLPHYYMTFNSVILWWEPMLSIHPWRFWLSFSWPHPWYYNLTVLPNSSEAVICVQWGLRNMSREAMVLFPDNINMMFYLLFKKKFYWFRGSKIISILGTLYCAEQKFFHL